MNSTNLQNHPTFHQKERLFNLHSTQKRALCWSIFSHMNIKILLRFIVIATGLNAVYSVPKKVSGIRGSGRIRKFLVGYLLVPRQN